MRFFAEPPGNLRQRQASDAATARTSVNLALPARLKARARETAPHQPSAACPPSRGIAASTIMFHTQLTAPTRVSCPGVDPTGLCRDNKRLPWHPGIFGPGRKGQEGGVRVLVKDNWCRSKRKHEEARTSGSLARPAWQERLGRG